MSRASATFRKVGPELEEFPVTTDKYGYGCHQDSVMAYEG